MTTYERAMWQGQLVTILERKLRGVVIRDAYGFVWTVRRRELSRLAADDERRWFTA